METENLGTKSTASLATDVATDLTTQEKLLSETALISWLELQTFFAQGKVIWVSGNLDLVAMATLFAEDKSTALTPLLDACQIAQVSNQQAQHWYTNKQALWSVVVAPFVLVQEPKS